MREFIYIEYKFQLMISIYSSTKFQFIYKKMIWFIYIQILFSIKLFLLIIIKKILDAISLKNFNYILFTKNDF